MNAGGRSGGKLDRVVAEARRQAALRERDYRARALKMYPVDLRAMRARVHPGESERAHRPSPRPRPRQQPARDGSNWELLCVYCHDNEHARYVDHVRGAGYEPPPSSDDATHRPFAGLEGLLKKKD